MSGTAVVVGSSVAGVRAAQALRGEGYEGRIVLLGAEREQPYDKPPLSKQRLTGEWGTERMALLNPSEAAAAGIEVALGVAAESLDPAGRRIALADGSHLGYDACVIATGARARPSPWPVASGVHVVRSLADSQGLRADLLRGGPLVVVGGGFIGAEVASAARRLGCAVTIVDPQPVPAERAVGRAVGSLLAGLHHRHGVTTRFGTGVESVTGVAGDLCVSLTDGGELHAATAVVGIGAVPNDGWLASSGLLVDDGVVCDEFCRARDAPGVFAAGDVARWFHPGHGDHVRVEHWTNAVDQAATVAHNIAHPGDLRPYAPVEYVWSDQYDWKIQIVGVPSRATHHTVIGRLEGASARGAALYADDSGGLSAAVTVNWPRALLGCRRLVAAGAGFDQATTRIDQLAARPPRTAGAA
jgi:phthalate 3,4-dioxygenase ferredoxin reductase subunit